MSISFAKLDGGIVDSTLWMQPHDVLRVWIAMLAKANRTGYVRASVPAMAHLCMVPIERLEQILAILTAPDPYSRTREDEGRRLRASEGGWQIVNYLAYRNARDEETRREQQREWDRANRPSGHARQGKAVRQSPTKSDTSDKDRSDPTQAEAEAEAEAEKEQKPFAPSDARTPPPPIVSLPLNDGSEYPITEEQAREFAGLYPAVDVSQALRSMRGWCVANPTNRKTRAGILRFVNRWLAKEQDSARPALGGSHATSNSGGKLSAVERVQAAIDERRKTEPVDIEGEATVLDP